MRTTETYETFCRYCLRRFERATLAESDRAVNEHESDCGKAKAARTASQTRGPTQLSADHARRPAVGPSR